MLELVLVAVLLCSTLVTWSVLLVRRRAGQPWVAYAARDEVPWGLLDVFLAILLLFVLTAFAMAALRTGAAQPSAAAPQPAGIDLTASDILAQSLASLAVLAISVLVLCVRYRAASADLGWSLAQFASDVRLGVVGFLALAPPVYALQLVLVQWFESSHPLIELMRRNPEPRLIVICTVSAVVVAPIVEEYLFRGLLQGWLERLADGRDDPVHMLLGGPARQSGPAAGDVVSSAAEATPQRADAESANPYQATAYVAKKDWGGSDRQTAAHTPAAYWPIVVSAAAFAYMHLSHGPDWIPLFLLALGLGYLYRQTHRLLPSITVHFLLNACSMIVLLVS